MSLTPAQIKRLRALAHSLDAKVRVGEHRISEGLVREVGTQLHAHELIKVKLLDADKTEVLAAQTALCAQLGCIHVQTVGHTLTLFKRNTENPKIVRLPGETLKNKPAPPSDWRRAVSARRAPSSPKRGKRRR